MWVDANANAVRVSSESATTAHKLEATVEVWRTVAGPYIGPGGKINTLVNGGCPQLHPNVTLHPDIVDTTAADGILFYHRNLEEWTVPPWCAIRSRLIFAPSAFVLHGARCC